MLLCCRIPHYVLDLSVHFNQSWQRSQKYSVLAGFMKLGSL